MGEPLQPAANQDAIGRQALVQERERESARALLRVRRGSERLRAAARGPLLRSEVAATRWRRHGVTASRASRGHGGGARGARLRAVRHCGARRGAAACGECVGERRRPRVCAPTRAQRRAAAERVALGSPRAQSGPHAAARVAASERGERERRAKRSRATKEVQTGRLTECRRPVGSEQASRQQEAPNALSESVRQS